MQCLPASERDCLEPAVHRVPFAPYDKMVASNLSYGIKHGPKFLLNRLPRLMSVLTICLCITFTLTWLLFRAQLLNVMPSNPTKAQRPASWSVAPKRLIVFGDSWSDNGQYPFEPPSQGHAPHREEAQGKAWTDWLCLMVCDDTCISRRES